MVFYTSQPTFLLVGWRVRHVARAVVLHSHVRGFVAPVTPLSHGTRAYDDNDDDDDDCEEYSRQPSSSWFSGGVPGGPER